MSNKQIETNKPIRVVMFGSGPELNPDARQFLCLLEENPEIDLVGVFCQAQSQSLAAVIKDLWKRRGWLAIPLFFSWILSKGMRCLIYHRQEISQKETLKKITERIHFIPNIHAPDVLDEVRLLEPDLGLIYGSPILKPSLFEIPSLGTLGIHHGKVPEYRGNKTAFWAIYNGEATAGVTIQKINRGLDTGNIVKEAEVKIGRRSYRSVVHELEELGLNLYIQAILDVKHGTAEYKPQIGNKGRLYLNPKIGDFIKFFLIRLKKRLEVNQEI